jgi:hypothetical protein
MLQHFKLLLSIFVLSSFQANAQKPAQIIFDRIEFVFGLKQTVDNTIWPSFNDKIYDVPLVYFTDSVSYIANPTNRFLAAFKSKQVYQSGTLKIYKTDVIIDDIPFHMFTGMTMGTPSKKYDYHSPFMKCSSFEIAKRFIPPIRSTEEWATMISHEYFHGFQYKHPAYLNYLERNTTAVNRDSLQSIYTDNDWFKMGVDQENDFLLKAIKETDQRQTNCLVDSFFKLRNARRSSAKQQLHFATAKYEQMYETMEGTARYVEYNLYAAFQKMLPDIPLAKSDSSFKSFEQYKNYDLADHVWLYKTAKSAQYFYATGFNMAMLLDKLKVDYKSKLFKEGALSLEAILLSNIKNIR